MPLIDTIIFVEFVSKGFNLLILCIFTYFSECSYDICLMIDIVYFCQIYLIIA